MYSKVLVSVLIVAVFVNSAQSTEKRVGQSKQGSNRPTGNGSASTIQLLSQILSSRLSSATGGGNAIIGSGSSSSASNAASVVSSLLGGSGSRPQLPPMSVPSFQSLLDVTGLHRLTDPIVTNARKRWQRIQTR